MDMVGIYYEYKNENTTKKSNISFTFRVTFHIYLTISPFTDDVRLTTYTLIKQSHA